MNSLSSVLRIATVIVCLLLPGFEAAGGQLPMNLTGPSLGYVFDSGSASLRPLLGILGSSIMGKPVEFGFMLSQALTLGPRFVVASTNVHPDLVVLDMGSNPPSMAPIAGVPAAPSLAAASLHGTSAAFYDAGSRRAWIVTGLPHKPAASHTVELSSVGVVTHMAVRDDGQVLVFSANDRREETLYDWTAPTGARRLMPGVSIGGIAMTGNGAAIVADRGANEVFAVWDAGGAAIRQFLAGVPDGVSLPVGVAVSGAGRIHIANKDSASTMTLDPAGRLLTLQKCDCEVSGLYALSDSVFRLTGALDRTVFLLDATSAEDRILFVPRPENAK
jgi:hypothetical protein